jgi:hypothetical protein
MRRLAPYALMCALLSTVSVGLPAVSNAASTAAAPSFSPAAGSYSSAQTVSLADGTPGATIYYTLDGSTPTASSSIYSAPLQVSATTTINAIAAASGYTNSALSSATFTIAAAGAPVNVVLSSADNVYGIASPGSAVAGNGLDGANYAYAANLLGTSILWNSSTFTLGAAAALDAVASTTLPLPAGNYSTLNLLGSAAGGGNQPNQTFIVTYSDGTTSSFTQGISDWFSPQGYAGENIVSTMAYRITPTGTPQTGPFYLYGYSFALNSAKKVASITLPNNRSVIVLAMSLLGAGGTPVSVILSSADNAYGIANTGSAVPGNGLDGSNYAYAATLLGPSLTWNSSTFTLGAAAALDAVDSQTLTLPAGNYATVNLLGAAVGGNQPNQTFVVTYADGTTSTFTQSMSDWLNPQSYAGESTVSTMAYRIAPTGATAPGPCYLYGYSFALDSTKSVASITLPNNRGAVVLAVDLTPAAASVTPTPASIAFSSASYVAVPSAGTTLITVDRTGDPTAAIVATYMTYDGSAIAGTDYTATSGTLSWASGDATPKSFAVPIASTSAGNNSFSVALISTSGAAFGNPNVATVLISAATASTVSGLSGPAVPAAAAAVSYNTLTFGPAATLSSNWFPFNFYGGSTPPAGYAQNSDGSVYLSGAGNVNAGASIATAFQTSTGNHWSGTAFGGGAYFEATLSISGQGIGPYLNGGPAFWALDVEHTSQGPYQVSWPGMPNDAFGNPYDDYFEIDFMEYDCGIYCYQNGIGNWYGYPPTQSTSNPFQAVGGSAGSVLVPPGTDLSQYHKYGCLWVPATPSTLGYLEFYFDGVQTGETFYWNYNDAANPFPPPPQNNATAMSGMDQRHMFMMLGTGTTQPMTVQGVSVWQASAANNLTE